MKGSFHVVGVVGNDIVNDARVRKVAATAAAAGFRSTILCYTSTGVRRESRMGQVEVIRVPVPFAAHAKNGRVPALLRPFNAEELAHRHTGPRIHLLARKRTLEGELSATGSGRFRQAAVVMMLLWTRMSLKIRHEAFRVRRKLHVEIDRLVRIFSRARVKATLVLFRRLRDPVPNIADYEVAFGPILEELEPDLIHAHDYHMIGVALTAARRLRRKGTRVAVVYDAHEWIEGLSYPRPTIRGWLRLQDRFIRHADSVIGVSPEQTQALRQRYDLQETPTVILNAPIVHGTSSPKWGIRTDVGSDGPILIYHGNVGLERGLGTLIDALPMLDPAMHVAILAPRDNPAVDSVAEHVASIGLTDRVHILDYVPADQLAAYLSSADLAVIPYLPTGNNDIALPNKLFEAIQAGLPLLVSDMRAMARLVGKHGIGEVFRAGDPSDLAEKAKKVLASVELYRARLTPEMMKEYSWDSQASKLASLYGRLLGAPAASNLQIEVDLITEEMATFSRFRSPRLAIGPRNMAGQAYAIASAVQQHLGVPAISFALDRAAYDFPAHVQIWDDQWRNPTWQAAQHRLLTDGFTHVIAESGTGLLGTKGGGFIDEQLEQLTDAGLRVAVLLHGSEIRNPDRHRQLPYSPYARDDDVIEAVIDAHARLGARLKDLDVTFYVTTPDLAQDIDGTWLPAVIDFDRWSSLRPAFSSPTPTVLHLPTNSILKGTEYVDSVISSFEERGLVRYLRPKRTRADGVLDLVAQADIVVDQVVIGAYGVMSIQALAAGRLSIANVRDIGSLKTDCPIVDADPGTLKSTIEELLDSRSKWVERAEAGRAFAGNYHDGRATAGVLRSFINRVDREE